LWWSSGLLGVGRRGDAGEESKNYQGRGQDLPSQVRTAVGFHKGEYPRSLPDIPELSKQVQS
jgi:hypothetical protein